MQNVLFYKNRQRTRENEGFYAKTRFSESGPACAPDIVEKQAFVDITRASGCVVYIKIFT